MKENCTAICYWSSNMSLFNFFRASATSSSSAISFSFSAISMSATSILSRIFLWLSQKFSSLSQSFSTSAYWLLTWKAQWTLLSLLAQHSPPGLSFNQNSVPFDFDGEYLIYMYILCKHWTNIFASLASITMKHFGVTISIGSRNSISDLFEVLLYIPCYLYFYPEFSLSCNVWSDL